MADTATTVRLKKDFIEFQKQVIKVDGTDRVTLTMIAEFAGEVTIAAAGDGFQVQFKTGGHSGPEVKDPPPNP